MISLNTFKKKIYILLIAVSFIPIKSFAIGAGVTVPGLPFGGFVDISAPCSCSKNLWILFTPFYSPIPKINTGALLYQPGFTAVYGYFFLGIPSAWHVGLYTPYVPPPAPPLCWHYVGTTCVPTPYEGVINKVGTNMP